MSVGIKYDQSRKLLNISLSGTPDFDDISSALEIITNSGEYPPDTKAVWDIRKADFLHANFTFVSELVKIRSRFKKRSNCRSALIVSSNVQYGLSRMFETLSEGKIPHQLKVFRDYEEGEKWLVEQSDS